MRKNISNIFSSNYSNNNSVRPGLRQICHTNSVDGGGQTGK